MTMEVHFSVRIKKNNKKNVQTQAGSSLKEKALHGLGASY